jgi:hypothetical protein
MTNATTAKEIKTMQTFTTADTDRLLGLADQFMEDWEANEGKHDPECAERRAEWNAIRPLLVQAPAMLTAIRTIIERADEPHFRHRWRSRPVRAGSRRTERRDQRPKKSSTGSGVSHEAGLPLDRRVASRAFRRWSLARVSEPLLLNTLFTNSAIPLGLALPVQDRPLDFFPRLREVCPGDQP